ncbi:hypothetical protein MFIFM68171_06373 [Madurella fahalii]|uniref:Uncharacterized protein n=1 Tax=Madurella fahalii TaxID=1157608 RepID=A0ABQ0GEJ2_9PEZI
MTSHEQESSQAAPITAGEACSAFPVADQDMRDGRNSEQTTMVNTPSGTLAQVDPAVEVGEAAMILPSAAIPSTQPTVEDKSHLKNVPDADVEDEDPNTFGEIIIGVLRDAPPIKVVSYHVNADLEIRVPGQRGDVAYNVCSALVAAASPTWRKTLVGPRATYAHTGERIMRLADIDNHIFGVNIVFSIIHWNFHNIPGRLDIDQLYSVARVVEQFSCAHLLVPFMKQWIGGLNWHILMNGEDNDDDKTLYLAWVLGEATCFAQMVVKVSRKVTLSKDGTLLDTRGQPWEKQGLPRVILDMITKIRYDALSKIILTIEQPLRVLSSLPSPDQMMVFCHSKDPGERDMCENQQLGSLVRSLKTGGLAPCPTADEYRGRVADLAQRVKSVKVTNLRMAKKAPHLDSHANCGIHHKEAVESIMHEDARMSREIVQQLKARAQMSGAFNEEGFKKLEVED